MLLNGSNAGFGLAPERAEVRPLQEDDRPLVTRILQALPKQPPTPYAGWARYRNECADFVDRLRFELKA
jgi:hypothetical protein